MPSKRRTIAEARFPSAPEFEDVLAAWTMDAAAVLLYFTWKGYDLLQAEVLNQIDVNSADENLERSLTQLLEPRIRRSMSGDEPFDIQHGSYEHETRQLPPAQPPQYDLAFVLRANPRIMWPLEAKVIRAGSDIARYVREIKANFVTARYAPFSRQGAMLGYVLTSDVESVFANIAEKVPCTLEFVPEFSNRPHRRSRHTRSVQPGKTYPREFDCHHLLMVVVDGHGNDNDSQSF